MSILPEKKSIPLKQQNASTPKATSSEKKASLIRGRSSLYPLYDYNHRLELVREINALGESTLYDYDAGNKNYEEKVGSGKKIYFTCDLANRLIEAREVYDGSTIRAN